MSSFLISELKNLSKENLNFILNITNEKLLNDISKLILSKNDKDAVLFLIQNDKIPKSVSLNLFQFIVNNKHWDMFLNLDYNKFDIHSVNDYALRMSSYNGHIDVVKFLIEKGADIHADNDCALRWSSQYGHIEVVKYLIEKGANIHADDDDALRWSSRNGHIEVVKFLVENGANIHANDDYALRFSSRNGHIEVVKFLIEKEANIHIKGDYPLRWSSGNGHIEVVKYLIKKGANIHADDDCALKWSSQNGHIEVVKFLVEKGADVHIEDNYALEWSSLYGRIGVVKFLIDSDIEYFSKNEKAINIVKNHKLVQFYEKFGININQNLLQKIPQSKDDIMKYIDLQDLESLKKCDEFDFSIDEYYYFFKCLLKNNIESIQIIFDKIKDKDDLRITYNIISSYFSEESKFNFNQLFKNIKLNEIRIQLEKLVDEIKKLEYQ